MTYLPFNINDNVRVKLSPYGHSILLANYLKLVSHYSEDKRPFPYRAPNEDAEGWSTWQMWCLMRALGEHVGPTAPGKNPFELNIQIEQL